MERGWCRVTGAVGLWVWDGVEESWSELRDESPASEVSAVFRCLRLRMLRRRQLTWPRVLREGSGMVMARLPGSRLAMMAILLLQEMYV